MKYRAIVTQVGSKGRIKVKCPDVWDKQESPWCYPCIPFLNLAYQPKTKRNVDEESKYHVRIPADLYQSEKFKVPSTEEIKDLIEESKDSDKESPSTEPVETPVKPKGGKGNEYTFMKPNTAGRNLKVTACEKCNLKYVIRLPEVGEYVWLEFEKDDVNSTPIYVGTWGDEEFWKKVELEP